MKQHRARTTSTCLLVLQHVGYNRERAATPLKKAFRKVVCILREVPFQIKQEGKHSKNRLMDDTEELPDHRGGSLESRKAESLGNDGGRPRSEMAMY